MYRLECLCVIFGRFSGCNRSLWLRQLRMGFFAFEAIFWQFFSRRRQFAFTYLPPSLFSCSKSFSFELCFSPSDMTPATSSGQHETTHFTSVTVFRLLAYTRDTLRVVRVKYLMQLLKFDFDGRKSCEKKRAKNWRVRLNQNYVGENQEKKKKFPRKVCDIKNEGSTTKSHSCRWFQIHPTMEKERERGEEGNMVKCVRKRNLGAVDSCDTRLAYTLNSLIV